MFIMLTSIIPVVSDPSGDPVDSTDSIYPVDDPVDSTDSIYTVDPVYPVDPPVA
jgi:hypothetical protein